MEMNNLRTESHVAQKIRRHKLRFQQNSDDPTHQHSPQDPNFPLPRPRYGAVSYDPLVFHSEMLNSITMLPPNHNFTFPDSCSGSVSGNPQNHLQVSNDWNVVTYPNVGIDQNYHHHHHHQDLQNINSLQEVVTVGSHDIPYWMNPTNHNQLGFIANNRSSNDMTQGLSLSLSSGPKALKVENLTDSEAKGMGMGMGCFVGPLGPFTGYATILKNSKYLQPAQELLSGSCDVGGDELCEGARRILEQELGQCVSSSGNSGLSENVGGLISPEFHHKKAKLLYMQQEVCRRYKQYHQQMQMVISSFETVAGLTSSTPYISLALKSVSRHFHFVKNAISEQLTQMRKTFEDLCSSKTFDPNNTTDALKPVDHNFQRHGKSSGATDFYANQQPVWRPQRGLPERAVSVLKAWLFDHFLHPYPSDADKHMLATQTGLTRNQVSNWFINARVRIWKPMVEEIHTLETKGLADSSTNKPSADGQDTSRVDMGSMANKQQPECSRTSGSLTMINGKNEPNEQLWDQEKRSRPDYDHIPPATVDRSFAHMMPYPRTTFETGGTTFETGGVGPVSLTLGLWQNAEHVQQLQQHEHQFRQHFGGQLIHDFVG